MDRGREDNLRSRMFDANFNSDPYRRTVAGRDYDAGWHAGQAMRNAEERRKLGLE
jgi:hypothetical protein